MNCHKEGYFDSFLTFFILQKVILVTKKDMVAKKSSGIGEADNKSNVGKKILKWVVRKHLWSQLSVRVTKSNFSKMIKEVGKKQFWSQLTERATKEAILVKIIREVAKKAILVTIIREGGKKAILVTIIREGGAILGAEQIVNHHRFPPAPGPSEL